MAGDWIKIEHATPEKPEVMQIAEILGITENEVLGALVRFWIWCDNQSRDGHALGVTKNGHERVTNVTGMFDAMLKVGWLVHDSGGIHVPNFNYHLSENAKTRALTAKRKRKQRVTEMSRSQRDKNVTREEKRRDLRSTTTTTIDLSLSKNGLPKDLPTQAGRVSEIADLANQIWLAVNRHPDLAARPWQQRIVWVAAAAEVCGQIRGDELADCIEATTKCKGDPAKYLRACINGKLKSYGRDYDQVARQLPPFPKRETAG